MGVASRLTGRFLQAIIAVVVVGILLASLLQIRSDLQNKEASVAYNMSALSWKVSETVFEAQRLIMSLRLFELEQATRDDVMFATELFWSRVEVLRESELINMDKLALMAEAHLGFLQRHETVIFDAVHLDLAQTRAIATELRSLMEQMRSLWIRDFLGNRENIVKAATQDLTQTREFFEMMIFGCIVMLSIYMIAEIFGAQRAHEQERALRQEALSASAAKSAFLANVSHEIRTPLNGVMGMAQELSETRLTRNQRHLLDVILSSGDILLGTINDVLDLSKVEAGRLELDARVFDPVARLRQSISLSETVAREKGLDLACHIPDDFPDRLRGDPMRMAQVVNNLLSNAVKFTETGKVELFADADVPDDTGATIIRITVKDTGEGIAEEKLRQIFQPFTQADASTTRKHGGTGLGLSISHKICRVMGGDLTATRALGQGSAFVAEFRFETTDQPIEDVLADAGPVKRGRVPKNRVLDAAADTPAGSASKDAPRHAPARAGKGAEDQTGSPGAPPSGPSKEDEQGLHLLLVDDSSTNRMVMRRFIESRCAEVVEAENGSEAVSAARGHHFDVILMDVQMPVMDGLEATQIIRDEECAHGGEQVPIFAVTANVMTHQVEEYLERGMNKVIAKPVRKTEILDLLDNLIETRVA